MSSLKNPERKFIHDISSPLGVVYGMVETVLEGLKTGGGRPEDIQKLEKALRSLNKVTDLIHTRREEIVSTMQPTEEPASGESSAA
ncbi:MAG: hypothetical protein HY075_12700 [Deltaproteobacteria bacterium]|nr:hypothetical protein [Deltaproteobacteria bacterium]